MWMPRAIVVLIGLMFLGPLAQAQLPKAPEPKAQESKTPDTKAADAKAQEFRLEQGAALADLPVAQWKQKTIAFAAHPPENLADRWTGFMSYEGWARAEPLG